MRAILFCLLSACAVAPVEPACDVTLRATSADISVTCEGRWGIVYALWAGDSGASFRALDVCGATIRLSIDAPARDVDLARGSVVVTGEIFAGDSPFNTNQRVKCE